MRWRTRLMRWALLLLIGGTLGVATATAGADAYRRTLATPAPDVGQRPVDIEAAASATPSPPASATAGVTPSAVDGMRITVPRLGIDLPLAVGDIDRDVPRVGFAGATPEQTALVFPLSAAPGAGGNTYIYAHARTGMFLALWNVRVGDDVRITRPALGDLRYRVAEIHPRVDPADVSWLDPAGPERVTLQTSTGPYPSDPRFVVIAYPVPAAADPRP